MTQDRRRAARHHRNEPHELRLLGRLLGLCLAASLLALAVAVPPAHATTTGGIAGVVTDTAGQPLTGIGVDVFDASGNYVTFVATAPDGTYDLGGLPAGSYILEFSDSSGNHLTQYYDDEPSFASADPVSVTAGQTTSGIDATLAPAGYVSGTVRNASGAGLAGIRVYAYDASGNFVNDVLTASDGSYDLGGLPTGSYRLEFEDPTGTYAFQYYDDESSLASADLVSVTAGQTAAGIDATLALAGHISGTVTNASGSGLAGIFVAAYDASGNPVGMAVTASDGSYDLGGLATGSYRLEFYDPTGTYAFQFYDDESSLDEADGVSVTAGATTAGIDATLAAAGQISGTVTNTSGSGLAGIDVTAYDASGNYVGMTVTASGGSYDLGRLPAGSYRLMFQDGSGSGYATLYYDGEPDLAEADGVAVSAGATTSGIGAVLVTKSSVSADTTPPTTSLAGLPSSWVDHAAILTFTASDNAGGSGMVGGLAKTEYKLDGGAWRVGSSLTISAPADHSGDGIHTVSYRSCDAAGNWETPKTATVKIDTVAPTTSVAGADSAWHSGAVTLTFTATDNAGGSGVAATAYEIDGGAWTVGSSCQVSGTGTHTVAYRSTDAAGNVEVAKTATVKIDAGAPSVLAAGLPASGWSKAAVSVALAASGGPSGATAQYALDGGPWTTATNLTVTSEGKHTLAFRALSGAGLAGATTSASFTIDTIGPRTAARATSGRRGRRITLYYRIFDNLSPKATDVLLKVRNRHHKVIRTYHLHAKRTGLRYHVCWTPRGHGSYHYYVYAHDLAGNRQVKVGSARVVVR